MTRTLLAAVAWIGFAGCSGATRSHRPDGIDVSDYPDDIQDAYGVFEYRCSRCHSLARPLNAQITDTGFWADYVERMRRMPGSGINRRDARTILKFLVYYTEHRDSRGSQRIRRYAARGSR
jgi:hypothetical protein